MNVLGIFGCIPSLEFFEPSYHDSSISIIKDNSYIGSYELERFLRKKHTGLITNNFLELILSKNGLNVNDIDYVAIVENHSSAAIKNYHGNDHLLNCYKDIFPNSSIISFDHHFTHAAASFLTSGFRESNFLTIDGLGNLKKRFTKDKYVGNSGLFGIANNDPFEVLVLQEFNDINVNSFEDYDCLFTLGTFYASFSTKVFIHKFGESVLDRLDKSKYSELLPGKIMGMSGYGYFDTSKIPELISVEKISDYFMPEIIYNYPYVDFYEEYLKNLEAEKLAYWLQSTFENVIIKYLNLIPRMYKKSNLSLSGGCALNVLLNDRILKENIYNNLHVHPATSDGGLSLGAALLASKQLNLNVKLPKNLGCVGFEYDKKFFQSVKIVKQEKEMSFFELIESLNLTVEEKTYEDIYDITSKALSKNKIVAWFQGRSEYGPRALGNRSILANPHFNNKQYLNEKVKFREEWRPYAAIVLEELQNDWFEISKQDSYYMLFSSTVREEKRNLIPAVTHIDNTCRIQTVNSEQNEKLYSLLKSFYQITNIPVLLNTSFNTIKDEPIVETPIDALKSFVNSKIDLLIINNYVITKEYNETHNGEIIPLQIN